MGAYAANMLDRRMKRHERYAEHLRIAIEALLAGTPIVDSIPPERAYSSFYAMLNRMRTIPTVESAYTAAAASGVLYISGFNLDLAAELRARAWDAYNKYCSLLLKPLVTQASNTSTKRLAHIIRPYQ